LLGHAKKPNELGCNSFTKFEGHFEEYAQWTRVKWKNWTNSNHRDISLVLVSNQGSP
jgi:hypothetical protein